MRFTLALAALASVLATASATHVAPFRRQSSIPSCAQPCLLNADTGNCGQNDACLCRSSAFINSTTTCIEQSCTGSDLTNAEAAAQALCAAVGVTLTEPSATATAPASSGTASSSSSTGSASASSASQSSTTSGARSHGANIAAGLAAVGLAALAL